MRNVSLLSLFACVLSFLNAPAQPGPGQSKWVYVGNDKQLKYLESKSGDKIMDFSFAGYKGGGVPLPQVPAVRTLSPSGSQDDSERIQEAIDEIARLPLKNGLRGALLLSPGNFTCSKTIYIPESGIVLRGSGSGKGGTTIHMTGPKHAAIIIGRKRNENAPVQATKETAPITSNEPTWKISDAYVPSGARSFKLDNVAGLRVGDLISVVKPVTDAWTAFMEMNTLQRQTKPQIWISTSRSIVAERQIASISGNLVKLTVPLSDSYNKMHGQSFVKKSTAEARVSNAGVENLHVQCPPLEIIFFDAPYSGARVEGDDCWLKDIFFEETMSTTALKGSRITVQNVVVKHTYPNLGGPKPADFSIEGGQVLIDRCKASGGNTYFVWTGALGTGPNVVLNSLFTGFGSRLQPHQRWSTGLLFDNCVVPDGGIDLMNRGAAGSGHGWTIGWAVAWNCIAKNYVIQNPPGVLNWAIGCSGERLQIPRLFDSAPLQPEGEFDSHGRPVAPRSLYLAQLKERKGEAALRNLGYSDTTRFFSDQRITASDPQKTEIHPILGENLALHRPVNASNVREGLRLYGAERALDADPKTYWTTNKDITEAVFEIDTEGPLDINAVRMSEFKDAGSDIRSYRIEGLVDSDYKLLAQGTTVGDEKIERFPLVRVWKLRLVIQSASQSPALREVGLYRTE